jgi:hypothetical protein
LTTFVFEVREKTAKAGEHAWVKSDGIRTSEDLQDLKTDLLRELATSHTTLRRLNGDSNCLCWPSNPLWQRLQNDILSGDKTGFIQAYVPKAALEWRLDRNLRSVQGYIGNIAALLQLFDERQEPQSYENMLGRMGAMIDARLSETIWWAEISKHSKPIELGE